MATTSKSTRRGAKGKPKRRYIGKPNGVIQQRVREAGPQRFAVISVDCAKRRSRWMLCDYFGRVIVEPTNVEHNSGALKAMVSLATAACEAEGIVDSIVAVEMTGVYHKPVQAAFRKAGYDTRIVHPFASSHYRKPLHPDNKTDDTDLEAIFHAAINGYGLAYSSGERNVSVATASLTASPQPRQATSKTANSNPRVDASSDARLCGSLGRRQAIQQVNCVANRETVYVG